MNVQLCEQDWLESNRRYGSDLGLVRGIASDEAVNGSAMVEHVAPFVERSEPGDANLARLGEAFRERSGLRSLGMERIAEQEHRKNGESEVQEEEPREG